MSANQHGWQSYNFPFSEQEMVSQSFIDYSSSSLSNIDLDEYDETLVIHPKRSKNGHLQGLVAKHPSLPFLEPNSSSCSLPIETMYECYLRGFSLGDDKVSDLCSTHLRNFSTCHPDIMFATIAELLQTEMNCCPWSTCKNICHSIDLDSPWIRNENYCPMCSGLTKASLRRDENQSQTALKHLKESLSDIPPSLLENLLQESMSLEMAQVNFDSLMGNSLACHVAESKQLAFLLYPSGAGLDILNFATMLQSAEATDSDNTLFPSNPPVSTQQFSVQGAIRQIDLSNYSYEEIVVGIRSPYNCSFLQSCQNNLTDGNVMSLKPLETVAVSKQAMCLAVSPYVPGEGVVVTESGGVYQWRCSHGLTAMFSPAERFDGNSDSWYQCVYAANPQCIALANPKSVDLTELRAGKLFQRFFFSIPSAQVDSFECITSIQRHPKNCHHYILATDQSLLILDDRYLQHTVLKWRHHNQDPIQFIEVACDAIPDCHDTVVLTSGSKHHQTHCFQYSDTKLQTDVVTATSVFKNAYLPPQSTSLPWKVSSYSEWYYSGLSEDLTFSNAVAARLSQPLIGVCTMPHTSHPHKGFTVFQMSAAGDLFYQPFFSQNSGHSEQEHWNTEQMGKGISFEMQMSCQKWIDLVDRHMDDLKETRMSKIDFEEKDKRSLCLDFLSLPAPHPNCALCNDRQIIIIGDFLDGLGDSNICERCGLDISYGHSILRDQTSNRVITKSSLGIQHEVKELEINPDITKSTDPLSKSLLLNWNSEEAIPVDLDGHREVPQHVNDGQEAESNTKTTLMNSVAPSQGLCKGLTQENSAKGRAENTNKPVQVVPLVTDSPVLLNNSKPVLMESNKTMPGNIDEPVPEPPSKEEGFENQSHEERSKMNGRLPRQYNNSNLPVARKTEIMDSPSKKVSQNQDVKNSPRKRKQSSHVMGF